jgi:hypothetical protein
MSLDQEPALYDARAALHFAIPKGVTTFSQCSAKGCTKSARGGKLCPTCAEADLAALIGGYAAKKYADAIRNIRQLERDQIEIIRNTP